MWKYDEMTLKTGKIKKWEEPNSLAAIFLRGQMQLLQKPIAEIKLHSINLQTILILAYIWLSNVLRSKYNAP